MLYGKVLLLTRTCKSAPAQYKQADVMGTIQTCKVNCLYNQHNYQFKKGVGIAIKSKKTSGKLAI